MKPPTSYRYEMRRTNASSTKYGVCEVCKKFANEVYYQQEQASIEYDEHIRAQLQYAPGQIAFSYHGCENLFGHEECLIARRKHNHQLVSREVFFAL